MYTDEKTVYLVLRRVWIYNTATGPSVSQTRENAWTGRGVYQPWAVGEMAK